MGKSAIQKLIEERNQINNESIKTALDTFAKEKEKKQAKEILASLSLIDEVIDTKVSELRRIRAREKECKKELTVINNVFETFKTDANLDNFVKNLNGTKLPILLIKKLKRI